MSESAKAKKRETITTRIWEEIPEQDNPFAARTCYCSGFDVYGELLGRASWIEYLYLLFKLEPPAAEQARLLEGLAIALANPGPRDHSVRAAMNSGATGASHASALMVAAAVGAGNLYGGRELYLAVDNWYQCGDNLDLWRDCLTEKAVPETDVWVPMEHTPGFDPYGESCTTPVLQTLGYLAECSPGHALQQLLENREFFEALSTRPLSMTGVAAAAFYDLDFDADQAEMAYILLRLPGAAVHALEQEQLGLRRYPFFREGLAVADSVQTEK